MLLHKELSWIKGLKVALCEPDKDRLAESKKLFESYGLEVFVFASVEAIMAEMEIRRYSTHRFYLAVFVDFGLAEDVERLWVDVTENNPRILETPVVLMREERDVLAAQALLVKHYFKFELKQPIAVEYVYAILSIFNRWKKQQHDLSSVATSSVIMGGN